MFEALDYLLESNWLKTEKTLKPATEKAKLITDKMKELGILLSTDGPHNNVIKIKPPLVFTQDNAKLLVDSLSKLLARLVLVI